MTKGLIVAICGESGAGKSTTTGIVQDLGFRAYSLSGILRTEAEAAYGAPTRADIQSYGQSVQSQFGNDTFARRLVETTDLLDQPRAVVDGMRNRAEVARLREEAAARNIEIRLLALVLDAETRFARVQSRARSGDPTNPEAFRQDDERANDPNGKFQENRALIASADFRIENTGDIAKLRQAIADVIVGY